MTFRKLFTRLSAALAPARLRRRGPEARLHRFSSNDEYVAAQCRTNESKLDSVWVREHEIRRLADYVRSHIPEPQFGICHGVRNGREVSWLREQLGIEVIGTDISPTAVSFAHVVQWDFHNVNPDWVGRADFVYSNSLDHSHSPEDCLRAWLASLKRQGICFLHWSPGHNLTDFGMNRADCFQATRAAYERLIGLAGGAVAEILEFDGSRCIFVIRRAVQ